MPRQQIHVVNLSYLSLRTRHEAHDGVGRVVSVLPALLVHVALDGDGQGERVHAREGVPEVRPPYR